MSVITFPNPPHARLRNVELLEWAAKRQNLSGWLRSLADLVDSDGLATEPVAATVIFSGHAGDEVLHMGYGTNHQYFIDAATALAKVAALPPAERSGDHTYPRPNN